MVEKIKNRIKRVEHVCCTADIWSGRQRSFFGYTCHWIDNELNRKSAAIACCRFSGTHNYYRIADIIHEINAKFGICDDKLMCTITDNGSNYVKAFKEYGVQCVLTREFDSDSDSEDEEVNFDSTSLVPQLSKHVRCASHTLNLLATTDLISVLHKYPAVYEKHQRAFKKCSEIWNKCNRPKTAEKIRKILSASLKKPVITRWNSLYDSTRQLLLFSDNLVELSTALSVEEISVSEIEYLEEYCQFMQPIAEALDFLQREENIYFGYLAPTLLTLKLKIRKSAMLPSAKYFKEMSKNMEDALVERFRPFFELQSSAHDIAIAAMTCPTVKILNCIKLIKIWKETAPFCTKLYLEEIFVKAITNSSHQLNSLLKGPTPALCAHPFFQIDDSDDDELILLENDINKEKRVVIQQLHNFMDDVDNRISSIEQYPFLKDIFLKFNTALPSSAPVERLFSFAGIVNSSRRQNLSDTNFEKLVLAKANQDIH